MARPLANRVDPFGSLTAVATRGTFMGNRGGRIHNADRTLGSRRWVSKAWICCRLEFKGRHREVWGDGYTELFFLDEPTALAAGHRPCFECRRREAQAFAAAWARAHMLKTAPKAAEMDAVLHRERLIGQVQRRYRYRIDELPDAAFIMLPDAPAEAYALRGDNLLHWGHVGYSGRHPRPCGIMVDVLTPPAILRTLAAGYRPEWYAGPTVRR